MLTDAEHAEVLSAEQDQHIHDSCGRCVERNRRLIEAQKRIAELEQRPTHESVVKWLEALSRGCDAAGVIDNHHALLDDAVTLMETASVYRAEFMEPTDAD